MIASVNPTQQVMQLSGAGQPQHEAAPETRQRQAHCHACGSTEGAMCLYLQWSLWLYGGEHVPSLVCGQRSVQGSAQGHCLFSVSTCPRLHLHKTRQPHTCTQGLQCAIRPGIPWLSFQAPQHAGVEAVHRGAGRRGLCAACRAIPVCMPWTRPLSLPSLTGAVALLLVLC